MMANRKTANAKDARTGRARKQQGIALIEALVGMLIFAFGVLGLVGLQSSMTQAQTSSRFRADAANLASELFGLIQTDHVTRISFYSGDACAGYLRCADWMRKAKATLPAVQTSVQTDAVTGTVNLTLTWTQGGSQNSYTSTMVWQQ